MQPTRFETRVAWLSAGPFVLWSEPIAPHTLENVGVNVIHAIVVELESSPAGRRQSSS